MSTISNRFYVTALEDGTTLHGNLASNKPLNQYWNGSSAFPNWTDVDEQPTIYVTLLSGSSLVLPDNNGQWFYNNEQYPIGNSDSRFQITTYPLSYMGQASVNVPALKIIANLASSANTDIDTITYKGTYTINGSPISFTATAQIRISEVTKGSNVGVINFVGGVSNITDAGQVLTMYGKCYGGETGTDIGGYTTLWYLNDAASGTAGASITVDGTTYTNAFQVSESAIIDHATIRCEFYKGGELLDTAYASVDDMQDPEFMYIQYNGNNGNAASLRTGQSAPFIVFIGSRDSATVRTGWEGATYKVQLLDGNGDIITASSLNDIPNPDDGDTTNYYRTLEKYQNTDATKSGYTTDQSLVNKAFFSVNYSVPQAYGKNITGIIIAYSSQLVGG